MFDRDCLSSDPRGRHVGHRGVGRYGCRPPGAVPGPCLSSDRQR
jgi:hypothetical protein